MLHVKRNNVLFIYGVIGIWGTSSTKGDWFTYTFSGAYIEKWTCYMVIIINYWLTLEVVLTRMTTLTLLNFYNHPFPKQKKPTKHI